MPFRQRAQARATDDVEKHAGTRVNADCAKEEICDSKVAGGEDQASDLDIMANKLPESDASAARRYERYRNFDPYPDIAPALLNSADIFKYVCTTGMIYPFHMDKKHLSGASYQVLIKGKVLYWDSEGKHREVDLENEDQKFRLEPNSIAFITLEPTFRIPNYIALRHNLKITHIYKGLLLGTGPLVDPGFQGKLSIPLHNLTSNSYEFSCGDPIIDIEFTKISTNDSWAGGEMDGSDLVDVDYIPTEIKKDRNVAEYVRRALAGHNVDYVRSSIPDAIEEASRSVESSKKIAEDSANTVQRLQRRITVMGVIAVAALIVALFTLWFSVQGYLVTLDARIDGLYEQIVEIRAAQPEKKLDNPVEDSAP